LASRNNRSESVVGSLRTQSFWNIEKPISNIVFAIDIIFEDFLGGFDLLADLPTACICQTGGDVRWGEEEPKIENRSTFCLVESEKYQLETCGHFADFWHTFPATTSAKNSAS
jgi:hypothetical protein